MNHRVADDFDARNYKPSRPCKVFLRAEAHILYRLYVGPFEAQGELQPRPPKEAFTRYVRV
jgi:hypothetical protein